MNNIKMVENNIVFKIVWVSILYPNIISAKDINVNVQIIPNNECLLKCIKCFMLLFLLII